MASLLSAPGFGEINKPLEGRHVLVLGAGGVAHAIVHGLLHEGANVTIASRTQSRAEELAVRFKATAVAWEERHSARADIVINCTPIGMHPNVDASPYEKQFLRRRTIVFDTVYNPENTLFVKDANVKQSRVITGIEMFVRQAAMQFRLFTGEDAPIDVMREEMRQATSPARHHALV